MEITFDNNIIEHPLERLVSLVCSNLLKETTYYHSNDEKTVNLIKALNEVYLIEPEFILQLAYYSRNHMNLRSTSNFLLAYASIRKNSKEFLKIYFKRSTRLPTDVIEVVNLAQVLSKVNFIDGSSIKEEKILPDWKLTMTRELTESIKRKFADFDEYQLGKYCSEGRRKRKLLKRKRMREIQTEELDLDDKKHPKTSWRIEGKVLAFYVKDEENANEMITPVEGKKSITVAKSENKTVSTSPIVGLQLNRKRIRAGKAQQITSSANVTGGGMSRSRGRGMSRGRGRGMGRGMGRFRGRGRGMQHRSRSRSNSQEKDKKEIDKKIEESSVVEMKRLVKICKITQPQILVNKILGKKYPTSEEEYMKMVTEDCKKYSKKLNDKSKLFDKERAGKRMKLEIPKTWEVEVTKKGNTKETWEELYDGKNVPIFATLRNLRNVINSSSKTETHDTIISQLTDFNTIVNSKILPFQFYSAYKEISILDCDSSLKEKYLNAIEISLRISTMNNITRLPGKALIFVDVSGSMSNPLSAYSTLTMKECGILLALMINFSCDQSEFRIFSSPRTSGDKCHRLVAVNNENILSNFNLVNNVANELGGGTDLPIDRLEQCLTQKEHFDYIFIISDMMINANYQIDTDSFMPHTDNLSQFLIDYRQKVNPMMRYIALNLNSYGVKLDDDSNMLNIHITGFSDKVLSIVADQDPSSQVKKIKDICNQEIKK